MCITFLCNVVVFKFFFSKSFVEKYSLVFREHGKSFVIIGNSFFKSSHILECYSSNFVCISDKRVTFYSKCCIIFCSGIVLKVQFCDSSEKIWLSKIWFCLNYLVKILNREHIIIKVQGILSHTENLLCIYLSISCKREC